MINQNYIIVSNSIKIPLSEVTFQTSRSGGPGGQNVNKLETRVQLIFNIKKSKKIPEDIRERLLTRLSTTVNHSGNLKIVVQKSRSQWQNKQLAIEQLTNILKSALITPKKRKPTESTITSKEKRLKEKRIRGELKQRRKKEFYFNN